MGAFLIPSRGIEMKATAWPGEELPGWLGAELWTPGRNGAREWLGPSGSLTPGIGLVAAIAEGDPPRWSIPRAGRALAISPIPAISRKPAIRFRRILPPSSGHVPDLVKTRARSGPCQDVGRFQG